MQFPQLPLHPIGFDQFRLGPLSIYLVSIHLFLEARSEWPRNLDSYFHNQHPLEMPLHLELQILTLPIIALASQD